MSDSDIVNIYKLMRPKNICICKAVSEKTLVEAIQSEDLTLEELVFKTGASTKCGSCSQMVRNIYNREIQLKKEEKQVSQS